MKSKNLKVTEGIERNAAWASLTPAKQLAELDKRLGVGVGATRQRKLIAKRLAMPETAPGVPLQIAGVGTVVTDGYKIVHDTGYRGKSVHPLNRKVPKDPHQFAVKAKRNK